MARPSPNKRLAKELNDLLKGPPPGIVIDKHNVEKDIRKWFIKLEGAPGTLYEGEEFELQFTFGNRYPFDSPQVIFCGKNIPVHPHVYSNGHICLSILTEDWTPAMSVSSVCLSIVSMLSSCTEKKAPPDNTMYVRTAGRNPKNTKWWFHGTFLTVNDRGAVRFSGLCMGDYFHYLENRCDLLKHNRKWTHFCFGARILGKSFDDDKV